MILISGEALIDLIPDPDKDGRYDAVLGGSPYNVAIGLGRLGAPTSFVSRISADANGENLAAALARDGVDLSLIARDARPTPLAFVMRGTAQTGSRYSFYLDATAFDGRWPFPLLWPDGARHLHVGSIAAVDPRHGESVVAALRLAHERATTSFDPNIRPLVTPDRRQRGRAGRAAGLPRQRRQSERRGFAMALSRPRDRGHARAMGAARPELLRGDARRSRRRRLSRRPAADVAAPKVEVVDTVGAGDSFMSSLLAAMDRDGALGAGAPAPSVDRLEAWLAFAATASAITCTRKGSDPPTAAQVAEYEKF